MKKKLRSNSFSKRDGIQILLSLHSAGFMKMKRDFEIERLRKTRVNFSFNSKTTKLDRGKATGQQHHRKFCSSLRRNEFLNHNTRSLTHLSTFESCEVWRGSTSLDSYNSVEPSKILTRLCEQVMQGRRSSETRRATNLGIRRGKSKQVESI